MIDKQILRKDIIKKRKSQPQELRLALSDQICKHLLCHKIYQQAKSLTLYLAMADEVATEKILTKSFIDQKKVYMTVFTPAMVMILVL